jgi:hypothetical protein
MINPIDKIKKLLRLSKSPNPHEAELALERAFDIAAKYNIDVDSLDLGEDLNTIITEASRVGMRLSLSKKLALNVVLNFFNVTPVLSYPNVKWIGTTANVAIGKYVWEFVASACDRAVSEEKQNWPTKFTENRRRNYIFGFFNGVFHSLNEGKEQFALANNQYGLVLAKDEDRRKIKLEEECPHTRKILNPGPKRRDRNWMAAGWQKGRDLEINPGLAPPAEEKVLTV